MSEELKACYKCKKTDKVRKTKFDRTVKYKGKIVTYIHEGHHCDRCDLPYDHAPDERVFPEIPRDQFQTEINKKRLDDEYLKIVEVDGEENEMTKHLEKILEDKKAKKRRNLKNA